MEKRNSSRKICYLQAGRLPNSFTDKMLVKRLQKRDPRFTAKCNQQEYELDFSQKLKLD